MKTLTVVHANELIEASYNLSIDELRVIALASTKVDSRASDVGEIKIDVAEFINAYKIDARNAYSCLRNAVKSIMRKPIRILSGHKVLEYSWLSKNEYFVGDGSHVIVHFSPDIASYLFELKERFTSVNFDYAARLNTPFSFRLYQWLYKAKNLTKNKKNEAVEVILDIDWIKSQAGMGNKYNMWQDFNNRVIKPAIEKINANTDLSVIYEPVKTGRKVTAVKFIYAVETQPTQTKPLRPRLFRRPKVVKGSHAEGEWMRVNFEILKDYEKKLKEHDPSAKLSLPDLRKYHQYASLCAPKTAQRLLKEINQRECTPK